jgi:prevent-host-death family protein
MNIWAVQDAKARFSEFLNACLSEGPQTITRRGAEMAVLVPAVQWRRMQATAHPSLKALLLSEQARTEQLTPEREHRRGQARRRPVEALD